MAVTAGAGDVDINLGLMSSRRLSQGTSACDELLRHIPEDHIHNFTNMTRLKRILETVTLQLQSNESRQQYIAFRGFNESNIQAFDRLPGRRQYRLSCSNGIGIVKIMPGIPHELGSRHWNLMVFAKMVHMGLPLESLFHRGSARVDGRLPGSGSKEPDECIVPFTRGSTGIPIMVVEIGVSESLAQLQVDAAWWLENNNGQTKMVAAWWLENNNGQTKMVLIIDIDVTIRRIRMETWILGQNVRYNLRNNPRPIRQSAVEIRMTPAGPQVTNNVSLTIPWDFIFDTYPGAPNSIPQDLVFTPAELVRYAVVVWA